MTSTIIKLCVLVCFALPSVLNAQVKPEPIPWSSFNELSIGIINSNFPGVYDPAAGVYSSKSFTAGAIASMETSFTLGYFAQHKNHKLKIGDIFRSSLIAGYKNADPHPGLKSGDIGSNNYNSNIQAQNNFWTAYRFELGLTALYDIKENTTVGMNLIPMIFSHDQITHNISGSSLSIWLRTQRLAVEAGAEAREQRFNGFLLIPSKPGTLPHQYHFKFTYIEKHRQHVGIECISFPNPFPNYLIAQTQQGENRSLTFNIFYGISF